MARRPSKASRKPKILPSRIAGAVRREYSRLRAKGWHAGEALRAAKVTARFRNLEHEGLVRLSVHADDTPIGDCFEDARDQELAQEQGLWGIVSERYCATCDRWTPVDSVWGFIGEDWRDSAYDTDVMEAAIEAVESSAK